jgi:hypothetical protein
MFRHIYLDLNHFKYVYLFKTAMLSHRMIYKGNELSTGRYRMYFYNFRIERVFITDAFVLKFESNFSVSRSCKSIR